MAEYNVQSFTHSNSPDEPLVEVSVGDMVRDSLLSHPKHGAPKAKVLEIWRDDQDGKFTVFGLKLDSEYLDGLRHPWEIVNLGASEKTHS